MYSDNGHSTTWVLYVYYSWMALRIVQMLNNAPLYGLHLVNVFDKLLIKVLHSNSAPFVHSHTQGVALQALSPVRENSHHQISHVRRACSGASCVIMTTHSHTLNTKASSRTRSPRYVVCCMRECGNPMKSAKMTATQTHVHSHTRAHMWQLFVQGTRERVAILTHRLCIRHNILTRAPTRCAADQSSLSRCRPSIVWGLQYVSVVTRARVRSNHTTSAT